jgi:hypothetical protein
MFADYAHHALAVHDLALVTDLFDGRPNLHDFPRLNRLRADLKFQI